MATIQPSSSLPQYAEDLIIVNTQEGGDPGRAKATPGFHYLFPQTQRMEPVRGIIAHCGGIDFPLTYQGVPVSNLTDIALWSITMREPSGQFILHDVPLLRFLAFARNAKLGTTQPKRRLWFFNRQCFPDPRQSYLRTNGMPDKAILPFSFVY